MRALIGAGLILWLPTAAAAIDIGRLVMPGPVIQGHVELETDCGNCHQAFDRRQQRALCLDFHEEVAADLKAGEGFHGRAPAVGGAECRVCHTEHKGRSADILGLSPEAFDHQLTDFALRGNHTRVACRACHAEEEAYRKASSSCGICHEQDDAHRGRLGTQCENCHTERGWRQARFDHDETDFPLEGHHAEVECNLCHAGERYEETPTACGSCHALDDAHRGNFGAKCQTCHTPQRWDRSLFDHGRSTKFPLHHRHAAIDCRSCHTGPLYREELDTRCATCHRADDVHRGRNGSDCASCHSDAGWDRVSFDHATETKFPLRGAHAEVRCELCHRSDPREERLESRCFACHAADDVHRGEQGEDCERCHNESGWGEQVFFDHDLTRFPLLGVHAAVACEECHATNTYRDTETRCISCHAGDDHHKGTLGPECATCHNPNGWTLWKFDHNRQTEFPLRGAHEPLNCKSCHAEPVEHAIHKSTQCASCHGFDDIHAGRFGRDCSRCHNERDWKQVRIAR